MSEDATKVILVLEDEVALLEVVKAKLEMEDFSVLTARMVVQALEYMQDGIEIDVIWLDHYLLGEESGLDFVAHVKHESSKWREIPIFVVSSSASPEKVHTYLKLGVNKYFSKVDHRLDQIVSDIKEFIQTNHE